MRAPSPSRRLRLLPLLVLAALAAACAEPTTRGLIPIEPPPEARDVERFVEGRLADARAFREQGRLEAAQRSLERALQLDPDAAAVHRLLARVLEEQGHHGEALAHWARADALDPPAPPPSDAPLPVESEGVVVLLVEPDGADGTDARPRRPDPAVERAVLGGRVKARLPWADVVPADPESVAEARETLRAHAATAAISLQTERGFCAYSRKDGDFGVAWLRVASATPTSLVAAPTTVREVLSDPPGGDACVRLVLARALEKVLLETDVMRAVEEAAVSGAWPTPALRALFPGLGRRVGQEIERGRARLATGRVAEAAEAFRAALAVDPDDSDARAYLREAEETLAIARALGAEEGASPGAEAGVLEFSLTPAERATAESLLAEERQHRDELLAALVITEVDERAPPPEAVATLRPVPLPEAPAPGPALARERVEGALEARALYEAGGARRTVYYFAAGSRVPLLREDDSDGDGRPDRWVGYDGGRRRDLFEDRDGSGAPDLHVVYDAAGDTERIEVDSDGDRRPERAFAYASGRLASEARDTDGDGVLDRLETFDATGQVALREEDLNGDGRVDVRTTFREGRMVAREIEDPAVLEALLEQRPGS